MKNKTLDILKKLILTRANDLQPLFIRDLVQTGKLTHNTIQRILSGSITLDELSTDVIVLMYQSIYTQFKSLKLENPKNVFTEKELIESQTFYEKQYNENYPLVFENVEKLGLTEQYIFTIDIKELDAINKAGLIHIVEGIQRESTSVKTFDGMIVHVKYNDEAAREIAKSMVNHNYYFNSIRLHLIETFNTKYSYDEYNKRLVIEDGVIACIDGQHRVSAIDYALNENPNLDGKFSILFTIGDSQVGQSIIVQEEKRQPIEKTHLKALENFKFKTIINSISNNEFISEYFPFANNRSGVEQHFGYLDKNEFAYKLMKTYDKDDSGSMKFYRNIESKLQNFFYDLIEVNEDLLKNGLNSHNIFTSKYVETIILNLFDLYINKVDIRKYIRKEKNYDNKHQVEERARELIKLLKEVENNG